MEEKIKQKRGGCGVGDTMKMEWVAGSANDEKNSCDEAKNSKAAARCNGCEAGRADCDGKGGLRSSSSLRVAAIKGIDIVIRGCYL